MKLIYNIMGCTAMCIAPVTAKSHKLLLGTEPSYVQYLNNSESIANGDNLGGISAQGFLTYIVDLKNKLRFLAGLTGGYEFGSLNFIVDGTEANTKFFANTIGVTSRIQYSLHRKSSFYASTGYKVLLSGELSSKLDNTETHTKIETSRRLESYNTLFLDLGFSHKVTENTQASFFTKYSSHSLVAEKVDYKDLIEDDELNLGAISFGISLAYEFSLFTRKKPKSRRRRKSSLASRP